MTCILRASEILRPYFATYFSILDNLSWWYQPLGKDFLNLKLQLKHWLPKKIITSIPYILKARYCIYVHKIMKLSSSKIAISSEILLLIYLRNLYLLILINLLCDLGNYCNSTSKNAAIQLYLQVIYNYFLYVTVFMQQPLNN